MDVLQKFNENEDKISNYEMLKDENKELDHYVEKLVSEVELLQNTLKDRNQTIDKLEDQMQKHEIF
jgi:hypothetical protein